MATQHHIGSGLILKSVTIYDPASEWHQQQADVHLSQGRILHLSHRPLEAPEGVAVLDIPGLHLSPGWMDVGVQLDDPGQEQREDWQSICAAAAAGGFTNIACRHDTAPGLYNRAFIKYALQAASHPCVSVHPIGASMHEGILSEMMDMHKAGAVAFSYPAQTLADSGTLLRTLQYTHSFQGVMISDPLDRSMIDNGQMHESSVSTSLGLRGIPVEAEVQAVERDLRLVEYTGARLHLMNVSCQESVNRIQWAKDKGLPVTASVAALNLCFTHEDLQYFDTGLKVLPPLRTLTDRKALAQGLQEGILDCISCNHVPWEEEFKKTVFSYARFGTATLETAFSLLRTYASDILSLDTLISALTHQAKMVYDLPVFDWDDHHRASLTLFLPDEEVSYHRGEMKTKSASVAGLEEPLRGKIVGIISGDQACLNSSFSKFIQ